MNFSIGWEVIITQLAAFCVQSLHLLHRVSIEVGEVREQVGVCAQEEMEFCVITLIAMAVIGVHSGEYSASIWGAGEGLCYAVYEL